MIAICDTSLSFYIRRGCRGVLLHYHIDPVITEEEAAPWIGIDSAHGREITEQELWEIEHAYNDHQWPSLTIDDRAYGDCTNGVCNSREKWLLFGTTYSAYGACMVLVFSPESGEFYGDRNGNALYGNYMIIAHELLTQKEMELGIENHGGVICCLMHEFGHSMGILSPIWLKATVDPPPGGRTKAEGPGAWGEVYANRIFPSDAYCVMGTFSEAPQKAFLYNHWYYSREFWALRYLDEY